MRIYNGIEEFEQLNFAVVTIGSFDGVHVGHQKIIERLTSIAEIRNGESVLMTFWPHPRHILTPEDKSLKILTTFDEKAGLLKQSGIDHLIKIPFTSEFSQLSSSEFIKLYLLEKINTKVLVIGYDHRFGKNREGSFENIKNNSEQYGFEVEEIPEQDINNVAVSSTKIRKALFEGNVDLASKFLGRNYTISGNVVPGNKIGRQLGFPTANILPDNEYKLIPGDGIYAVRVEFENVFYDGMLSIGFRPTIGLSERTIEVNIFNFNLDIYNQQLTIHFITKFRDEMKFDNLEELQVQLSRDYETATKILSRVAGRND